MTQDALLKIVRKARKTALFRWHDARWWVEPLPRKETLYVERDSQGFDWRGREDLEDHEDPGHEFMSVEAAAQHLKGDEIIRLQCWGTGNISGNRDNSELLDIWHLDLSTGEKIEVAPDGRPNNNIGNPTTTGVLPHAR